MSTQQFPISEIFGPTIQGEGSMIGTPAMFIRTAGCDYACAWCDTSYAQGFGSAPAMTAREIVDRVIELDSFGTRWVVLTGGNPAIWDLAELYIQLAIAKYNVLVETQGTACPDWLKLCQRVVVAPKGPSSGLWDLQKSDFERFAKKFVWSQHGIVFGELKLTVSSLDELIEMSTLLDLVPGGVPVSIQPVTPVVIDLVDTPVEITGPLAQAKYDELLIEILGSNSLPQRLQDARILPQLHKLVWGSQRCK